MINSLKGKHFVTTQEWSKQELDMALDLAADLKRKFYAGEPHRLLQDKTLFMMFFFDSTRTRNSFEAGMTQFGGHAHFIDTSKMQIKHGDTPRDIGEILSRYGHGIAIRHSNVPGVGNKYLRDVAKWSRVPVINMQCDIYHPCQAMADLMTVREKFGSDLRGRKFVMSWAYPGGYGTRPLSVAQSNILLMPRFGMDVTLAMPPEFKLMPEIIERAKKNAEDAGVKFEVMNDMDEALKGADVVYAKNWGPLMTTTDDAKGREITDKYKSWICDERRMKLAKRNAVYMHPLPAEREFEVTTSVLEGPQSIVYDQAENRMHIQKAIMALTMQ